MAEAFKLSDERAADSDCASRSHDMVSDLHPPALRIPGSEKGNELNIPISHDHAKSKHSRIRQRRSNKKGVREKLAHPFDTEMDD